MKKQFPLPVLIITLFLALGVGFFVGQEYTKYTIAQSFQEAFGDFGNSGEENTFSAGESQAAQNQGSTAADEASEYEEAINEMNSVNIAVGEPVELATRTYVIDSYEEKDMLTSSYSEPHMAATGTKFVVVTMTATNTTSETFTFDDSSILLRTSEGDFYETYEDTIMNSDNYLDYEELTPKIPVSGEIIFQLPETAESYELLFAKANSNDLLRVQLQ